MYSQSDRFPLPVFMMVSGSPCRNK